ncbi:MAG: PEP-utilizing enzyme [Phascolarctobacterium sp.]|nr:PEP-utilizing enzyme [Phascolarctobacterium sp.]
MEALLKGTGIGKTTISGKASICVSPEDYHAKISNGDIVVVPGLDDEFVPFVTRHAAAIITEEGGLTSTGAIIAITLKLPVIVGANGACQKLKDGQTITVNAASGEIFEGIVEP